MTIDRKKPMRLNYFGKVEKLEDSNDYGQVKTKHQHQTVKLNKEKQEKKAARIA